MLTNRFSYIDVTSFGDEIMHPDLIAQQERYKRIRDCLEDTVKQQGLTYLPDPSEGIHDKDLRALRYTAYHERAVFVPVVSRTREGLVAQVFIREPLVKSPEEHAKQLKRLTPKGTSAQSIAKVALGEVTAFGRGGFHVMYSEAGGRPFIEFIQAEDIITWAHTLYGSGDDIGRDHASVTIRIFHDTLASDGVSIKKVAQLIQYTLSRDGTVWARNKHSGDMSAGSRMEAWGEYSPVYVNGVQLRHIPMFPIGSEENTYEMQKAPLGEMSSLNISHYINSADYEEFAKLAGQVTPVFAGLKSKWYTDHIEGKVMFGMRTPVGLNEGATAHLLQAQPNSVSKEAMDKKESLMVAVGARLIEERKIRRTATEADIESQAYHSILGHIAYNVETALNDALDLFASYYTLAQGTLSIELHKDFASSTSDAEHRRLVLEEYNSNVRSFKETRKALRNFDTSLDDNDDTARDEIIADVKEFKKKIADVMTPATEAKATVPTAGHPKTDNRTKATLPKQTKED